jgi:hypothetical protein
MVAFGTLARAAAFTLASVSPASGVSSFRWPPHGFWGSGAAGADCVVLPLCVLLSFPLAAAATP